MTSPTPLSPAAQAVLDASMVHSGPAFEPVVRRLVAAALRAAADQVVPVKECGPGSAKRLAKNDVRYHLLAIAAELNGGEQ